MAEHSNNSFQPYESNSDIAILTFYGSAGGVILTSLFYTGPIQRKNDLINDDTQEVKSNTIGLEKAKSLLREHGESTGENITVLNAEIRENNTQIASLEANMIEPIGPLGLAGIALAGALIANGIMVGARYISHVYTRRTEEGFIAEPGQVLEG